jgi:hypothetical protein
MVALGFSGGFVGCSFDGSLGGSLDGSLGAMSMAMLLSERFRRCAFASGGD